MYLRACIVHHDRMSAGILNRIVAAVDLVISVKQGLHTVPINEHRG